MVTDLLHCFGRIAATSAFILAAMLTSAAPGQQAPPTAGSGQESARDRAKDKIQSARETKQGARQDAQGAREGARDTARDGRQTTRDVREGARDTARDARETGRDAGRDNRQTTRDTREEARDSVRDDRQTIREARRDVRRARREFIVERLRSGDLGLWVRRAANRLMVTDVAGRGAISQSGLKEGDEIVSVNGKPVTTERDFIEHTFADHAKNQPVQVAIIRDGRQQKITLQPQPFVEEHLANDDRLHEYGLILDESNPNSVKVQAVVPRSPAFYAGVRSGDQITAVRGERITALADFIRSIANAASGTTSIEVNRNNQTRQLDIEIPNEPDVEQPRTVLRPELPNASAPPAPRPQNAPSGTQPPRAPQPQLNPPR